MSDTDDTALREVDQALAAEQQAKSFRKNLPLVLAGAAIVVVGVGGWQLWSAQRRAASAEGSIAYDAALKAGDAAAAAASLQSIADDGGAYGALAKMRLAGQHAAKGERDEALGLYREVYGGGAGSKRLKDVARLKAAYLALDDSRAAVLQDVGELETDKTAIGWYAREIIALAALKAGDYQSAEQLFRKAASSAEAPEPIRLRAGEFAALASAGKVGVVFPAVETSKKSEVERYMESLEKASGDLSSVLGSDAPTEPAAPAEQSVPAETPQPEGSQ